MAKIPSGQGFGDVVAQPQRLSGTMSRGDFGGELAGAVEQRGGQLVNQERQEAARAEAQARATAEAAERAKAAMALQTIETDLDIASDEVAEGIRTGQIEKTQAGEEFKRRTQERITAGMSSIPQAHAPLAQASLNNRVNRLNRTVTKAVTERDQQDVRAGLQSQLEYAQRLYLKDPGAADQMVSDTIEALGPFSGLNPADLQKAQQGWREGTRLNKANALVSAARRDNRALDAVLKQLDGPEFADLVPSRKQTLLGQVEGYQVSNIQRAEADARRREAQAERQLRVAESQFNAAQSIITQGKVLSPEYVDQVSKAVAGTPYAAALRETLTQAPARAAFGMQPLAVQRKTLIAARSALNTSGTNPEAEKRVAELQRVYDASVKDYKEDPLLAAQERGVLQSITPVDTQSINGLVKSIGERIQQAGLVQQQTGSAVSPLLAQEAEQVGKMINILPVDQRAGAIAQISQVLGPQQASAFARQIAEKDKALGIAIGLAGSKTTQGRYTSEIVLRGAQAMKDKSVKTDNSAVTGIRARVAEEIGDAYPSEDVRETMIDAAVFAEYGLQAEGSGDLRRAVRLVTGGGIVERGGRKVPLPQGMTPEQFDTRLRNLTPRDLRSDTVVVGGQTISAKDFINQIADAPLIVRGNGRYAVQAGGALAMRPDGKPLIVEVR
ncbi:hypothetical protein [Hydrogenophaga sp.]|uniref:hypothetical protein n=1 Tax=Hydrogenophaga sp. TaxID=1904254 RepID=UPI00272FE8B8|nr:hypothetical protein [Hydrogenophaga sp.]MDP2074636.1 hypothetical protein [Hydrogenophaga sp.]MDP3106395.1 hypothetical protein [Hydrogenophaga sp.]